MVDPQVMGRPQQKARAYGRLDDEPTPAAARKGDAAGSVGSADKAHDPGRRLGEIERNNDESTAPGAPGEANVTSAADAEGSQPSPSVSPVEAGRALTDWNGRDYAVFVVFGMGSAWLFVNACYLELAIYQRQFGLMTSNRMTIGYDVGTFALPFFFLVRVVLRKIRKGVNYRMVITVTAVIQFAAMAWGAIGVGSLEALVFLNFLGGFAGYLAGVVHQGWLLMHCHNAYSAAFWVGDGVASCLAAFLAIAQQPELPDEEQAFGTRTFYILLLPLVPISLLAFFYIDHYKVGMLSAVVVTEANAGVLSLDEEEEEDPTDQTASSPDPANTSNPQDGIEAAVVSSKCGGEVADATDATPSAPVRRASSVKPTTGWRRFLPSGARGPKAGVTAALAAVVFWSQFANWGVLDSITPYSCEQASPTDEGADCVFISSYGTLFGGLIAAHAAGLQKDLSLHALWPHFFVYSAPFPVLCFAAMWGGRWASPLGHDSSGGTWIAALISVMRYFGPRVRQVVSRMVQVVYEPRQVESMNFFLTSIGTAANFIGVILTTIVLEITETD